jgi:AcrR family transcriptional regulator
MTMTESAPALKEGRVVGIAGPVVDVEFPRGALQHHFASKNDLLLAAHVHLTHLLHDRLLDMLNYHGLLEARCRHVVEKLWEVFGSPEYAAILELMVGTRGDPHGYRTRG